MDWEVWTDGSGTTGKPGGWAFVAVAQTPQYVGDQNYMDGDALERVGWSPTATNNQMELLAVIGALEFLPSPKAIRVWSDSQYVVNGCSSWMHKWYSNGWRTNEGKEVKNQELWKRMLSAVAAHRLVEFQWMKGHAGNWFNERCDYLANEARAHAMTELAERVMTL